MAFLSIDGLAWEAGWRYGIISTVMVGVMVSYLRLWLPLWYHIYGYGWRYGIISTVMVGVMVSYLRLWLVLWYHIYGYGWRYGIISTVMVSYLRLRLALWYHIYGYGWRYGIISTVAYEQQKINRQIILFQRIYYLSISLTGLPCHREPSIVLMSMTANCNIKIIFQRCYVDIMSQNITIKPLQLNGNNVNGLHKKADQSMCTV